MFALELIIVVILYYMKPLLVRLHYKLSLIIRSDPHIVLMCNPGMLQVADV